MGLHKKAYYNLLRFQFLEGKKSHSANWQVENLQDFSLQDLFQKINKLGVEMNSEIFGYMAQEFASPEEMMLKLTSDLKNDKKEDEFYLLIFEIWKRILPEKVSLSIFCDELDHNLFAYEKRSLENDEKVQALLANLEALLDENVDEGLDPTDAFETLTEYCAYDVSSFIYDYILEQIDTDNKNYALELLEGFYPYVKKNRWFSLLCLELCDDPYQIKNLIAGLIESFRRDPDIDFGLEFLKVMIGKASQDQLFSLISLILNQKPEKEHLIELVSSSCDFFRRKDNEKAEKSLSQLLHRITSSQPYARRDMIVKEFSTLIQSI